MRTENREPGAKEQANKGTNESSTETLWCLLRPVNRDYNYISSQPLIMIRE